MVLADPISRAVDLGLEEEEAEVVGVGGDVALNSVMLHLMHVLG